jgi:crotonobetainyl-CoA:carnitine CoA-transferase CaiB-like acyl-CoA transferase
LTLLEICYDGAPLHIRIATAMAGKILADFGAKVVRVVPPGGDLLDQGGPFLPDGRSALSEYLNTGRLLVTVSSDDERADVVREFVTRGVTGALIEESDPIAAVLSVAGVPLIEVVTWPAAAMAQEGCRRVSEFAMLAIGGILDMVGDPKREPLRLGGHQLAYAAGFSAFTAMMAAVLKTDAGIAASHARISMLETAVWLNWKAIAGARSGEAPTRRGDGAEFQVFRCADGWVAFIYTPDQFDNVRRMFDGIPLDDARFAERASRLANIKAFNELLKPWFLARTRSEIYDLACSYGVPLGPVYMIRELLTDAQFAAREFFAEAPREGGGRSPQLPFTWRGRRLSPIEPVHAESALQ